MTVRFIKVRRRDDHTATAELSETALQHFPAFEPVDPADWPEDMAAAAEPAIPATAKEDPGVGSEGSPAADAAPSTRKRRPAKDAADESKE